MSRRAESFPCGFCTKTLETRNDWVAHLLAKHRRKLVKLLGGESVTATVGVDVARISLDVECDEPVNFESGRYQVRFEAVS